MIKGGLGRMTPQEYDLSRFKGGPEPAVAVAPVAVSKGDMQRLRELEESMEATLKASATGAPSVATAPTPAPVVKKLEGGPAEAPTLPMAPEEKKDYQGEYYPVAKPHGKDEKP
jgi:hypothetical protein